MAGGSGVTHNAIAFTHRSIDALRTAAAPYRVPDQRCVGLAVRVAPSGLKTWDLAFRIRGTDKVRRMSLGRVGDVSLDQARDRAHELTSAARLGRDLVAEEQMRRAAEVLRLSVGELIEVYMRRRVEGQLRTAKEIEQRLRRALGPLMQRPADEIRRRDLRMLFDKCVDDGIEREAEKRRQTVGAMFRWALSQDLVETDPSAGLRAYNPGTPRDRVLTVDEISKLWNWLETGVLPPDAADVLRLELLIGARCGEISGLCAEEIDQRNWLWILPAGRSKNKRPRVTPLVGLARTILEHRLSALPSGPLFKAETGTTLAATHLGNHLLNRRRALPIAKFTTHDLRRTVATMLVEMGIALELVATVLGHEGGGSGTRTLLRHYVRTDLVERKVNVLRSWDELVRDIVAGSHITARE